MTNPQQTRPNNKGPALKCAHPGCHCPARPGEKYCSDLCENMVGTDTCPCGHPECKNHNGNKL
jgi:hypothetical protein